MNKDIKLYVNKFSKNLQNDENGRYKSYEHCRECFLKYKDDKSKYKLITLHLYAYLASWGMLRKSFLMQKDYLFNLPVVKILCKKKYQKLIKFNPFSNSNAEDIKTIICLRDEIRDYYLSQKYIKDGSNKTVYITKVTDTLITKIILGTIGCTPAYDKYFVKAIRTDGIVGTFNEESMKELALFAKNNQKTIEESCKKLGELYTPMKIIDMYFWEKGISKYQKKRISIKR